MNNTLYTYSEVDAAVCITEAIYDEKYIEIEIYRLSHGVAALRHDIITDCAPKLELAYQGSLVLVGETGLCFDLDIVPAVLKEVLNVAKSHLATSDVWNKAALKVLWLLEFDNYIQKQYSRSIAKEEPNENEFFTRWGQEGRIDYETAAKNYAYFLELSLDSVSKKRLNIIYRTSDNQILSIHDTPTICDEELTSYYRGKSEDHPSDRMWNQISVPFGVNKENVIGSKLSDWL